MYHCMPDMLKDVSLYLRHV